MSSKNRGDRIQLLQKVVSKHFTPVLAPKDRNVLEHLIYACCLEDAGYDVADEAFHRMQECFVDWNEVRVTTVTELVEHLVNLPDPAAAAVRVKKNLQSIFETRYSFDIEDLVKMNQGKAVAELEKLSGISKFVLNYVTQNALGGHAIPISDSIIKVLLATDIVSDAEVAKGQIPGLERTITKSKGPDFASCLHQFGLLVAQIPGGKNTKAILKEAGATEKKEKPKEVVPAKAAVPIKAEPAKVEKDAKKAGDKAVDKAPAKTKPATAAKKPAPAKKAPPAAPPKKSAPPKGATEKTVEKKPAPPKKSASKAPPPTKRKPK
jgi:hypothetical protein